jgi:hypothetical protein
MASGHMICLPIFIKINTGIQAILSPRFSNLKYYTVGITDRKKVLCKTLKWSLVTWYLYKFKEDLLRYLSDVTVNTATVLGPVVLVLLMWSIYELRRWNGLRWHDDITFHKDWFSHSKFIVEGYIHKHTDSKLIS